MTPITSPPRAPTDEPLAGDDTPRAATPARSDRRRTLASWLPLPMNSGLIGTAGAIAELFLLYVVGSSVRALVGLG